MLKIISLFCVLFLSGLSGAGRNLAKIPSGGLLQHIQQSKADTGRIKFLLALSKQLILKSGAGKPQIDSAYALEKQTEQLSIKANDLKNLGKSMLIAALIENKKGDKKNGLLLSQKALSLFIQLKDPGDEAEAYIIIGQHYGDSGKDVLLKIAFYKKAIQLFEEVGAKERQATTLTDLADFQQEIFQFNDSNNNLYEALSIYQAIGYKPIQNVYDLLGSNLAQTGDLANSLKYELSAIKTGEGLKDTTLQMCTIYFRTASTYHNLRKEEQSIFYGLKALKIARRFNDQQSVIIISQGLGVCYYMLYKYNDALAILKQLPEKYISEKDTGTRVDYYCQFVFNYIKINELGLAKLYFDRMNVLSKAGAAGRGEALIAFIKYYAATNQYQLSYPY